MCSFPPGLQTGRRKAALESLVLLSEAGSLSTDVTLVLVCAKSVSNFLQAWALSIHGRLEEE